MHEVALRIYRGIVEKTPVDTGRARGNWHISVGNPDPYTRETKTRTPLPSEYKKVEQAKPEDTIYIQNNLPYIKRLEYGSSKQAPQGMVRLTMQEVSTYIDEVVRAKK